MQTIDPNDLEVAQRDGESSDISEEDIDELISKFLIETAGLSFCKDKFFGSCSKLFKRRKDIIDQILRREDTTSFITKTEIENNLRDEIKAFSDDLTPNSKWKKFQEMLNIKAKEINEFFNNLKYQDVLDEENRIMCQNFKNLGRRYFELIKNFRDGRIPNENIKEKIEEFVKIEDEIYRSAKLLDKEMRKCRILKGLLKPITSQFIAEYATFLANTYGLLAQTSWGMFSSLPKWKNKRDSIVQEINKYISKNKESVPLDYLHELIENNLQELTRASRKYNEQFDKHLKEIIDFFKKNYSEKDLRVGFTEICPKFISDVKKLQTLIDELRGTSIDIDLLIKFDGKFLDLLTEIQPAANLMKQCIVKGIEIRESDKDPEGLRKRDNNEIRIFLDNYASFLTLTSPVIIFKLPELAKERRMFIQTINYYHNDKTLMKKISDKGVNLTKRVFSLTKSILERFYFSKSFKKFASEKEYENEPLKAYIDRLFYLFIDRMSIRIDKRNNPICRDIKEKLDNLVDTYTKIIKSRNFPRVIVEYTIENFNSQMEIFNKFEDALKEFTSVGDYNDIEKIIGTECKS